jgi:Pyruvate/2-oxoacid:ferredoxin oxidoreductase gamma subunit
MLGAASAIHACLSPAPASRRGDPVALMGDSIATNAFMLGLAFQKGTIPLSLEAILRSRS